MTQKDKKNLILWDWDNTLADTFDAILLAINDLRERYKLPPFSEEEARTKINKSVRNMAKEWGLDEKDIPEACHYFSACYSHYEHHLTLKENAKDILEFAKANNFYNVLASNQETSILLREAEQLSILDSFDRIVGAGDVKEDKPSKAFTDEAIKGFDVENIISIGDGVSDVKMGHNYENGVSILVFSNVASEKFKDHKPDYAVSGLDEAREILKRFIPVPLTTHKKNSPVKRKQRGRE